MRRNVVMNSTSTIVPHSPPGYGSRKHKLINYAGVLNCSQVPQPTCYWKWVGVSMPQKVGTFSLRPSSTAIWRCSRLSGGLLSSYRSQFALTPALEFYVHPVLLQPGIHVTLPILTSSPSQSSFRFHRFFYLYFPFPPS